MSASSTLYLEKNALNLVTGVAENTANNSHTYPVLIRCYCVINRIWVGTYSTTQCRSHLCRMRKIDPFRTECSQDHARLLALYWHILDLNSRSQCRSHSGRNRLCEKISLRSLKIAKGRQRHVLTLHMAHQHMSIFCIRDTNLSSHKRILNRFPHYVLLPRSD